MILFISYTVNPIWLTIFAMIIACGAVFEIYRMFAVKRILYYGLTVILAGYTMLMAYWKTEVSSFAFIFSFMLVLAYEVILYNNEQERDLRRVLVAVFANAYILFFLQYLVIAKTSLPKAMIWVPVLFISVWSIDTAAYAFGMWLGKNNRGILIVSPKKSLQGFLGGILFPAGLAVLFHDQLHITIVQAVLGMIVFATTVQIGDLAESLVKRYANVKDSSNIIIGHGGIFDRFDSLIFSVPVFFFLVKMLYEKAI